MILEVSQAIADAIAKAGASPPICFGRLRIAGFLSRSGLDSEKHYIGLCTPKEMDNYLRQIAEEHERRRFQP